MAKKQKKADEKSHPADWIVTYSDLISLLMVFFVLMYALSSIDPAKFSAAAASMNSSASAVSILETFAGDNIVLEMMGNGIIQFPVPPNSLKPVSLDDPQPGTEQEVTASDYEAQRVAMAGRELGMIQDDLLTYFPETPSIPSHGDSNETGSFEDPPGGNPQIPPDPDNPIATPPPNMPDDPANAADSDGIKIEREDFAIRITLPGSVSFESGRHNLTDRAIELLTDIADVLMQYPQNEIHIVGHADNQPLRNTTVYADNTVLSWFRAREVEKFFINAGLNEALLKTIARGEREPVATNDTPEGRELNRRVEILIYSTVYTGTIIDRRIDAANN